MILYYNHSKNDKDVFGFTSVEVNDYLESIYHGLSAKVFRTYRASLLMYEEICEIKDKYPKGTDKTIILNELRIS